MVRLSFPLSLAQLPVTAGAQWPETPRGPHRHRRPKHLFSLLKTPCLSVHELMDDLRESMPL